MNGRLPNEDDVAAAAARLAPFVRRTPLVELEVEGRRVLAKLEHMQLSGSFKLRGALNSALLARDAGAGTLVAASEGTTDSESPQRRNSSA